MINKLYEYAKSKSEKDFEAIGLKFHDPPISCWYDSTPTNVLSFASTGGDYEIFKR